MYNLVIFASGNGSTLQAVIDSTEQNDLKAKINLVVSDNPNAFALERAKKHNIPTYIIKGNKKDEIDSELFDILNNYHIDLIVLAGYLKLIGPKLVNKYKIINTHPALLPKFAGKGMYGMNVHKAVILAKEKQSGPTVHFVNENYDEGAIISQTVVDVLSTDTPESLAEKVQAVEKVQLIKVIKDFVDSV